MDKEWQVVLTKKIMPMGAPFPTMCWENLDKGLFVIDSKVNGDTRHLSVSQKGKDTLTDEQLDYVREQFELSEDSTWAAGTGVVHFFEKIEMTEV